MLPDMINGLFEGFASIFLLNHCRVLYREKLVRGVSLISTVFFLCWGFWNLFYYHDLQQFFSWYAGMAVVAVNALWVGLMIHYRSREKSAKRK